MTDRKGGEAGMHHYMAFYEEDGKYYVESWLQINLFGKCFCFSRIKREIVKWE